MQQCSSYTLAHPLLTTDAAALETPVAETLVALRSTQGDTGAPAAAARNATCGAGRTAHPHDAMSEGFA